MHITLEIDLDTDDLEEGEKRVKVIQKILECLREYIGVRYEIVEGG